MARTKLNTTQLGLINNDRLDADLSAIGNLSGTGVIVRTGEGLESATTDLSLNSLSVTYKITSTLADGTAPFTLSSKTLVSNLNTEYLNGQSSTYFLDWTNFSHTPTSLSGYGITNAYSKTEINNLINTFTFTQLVPDSVWTIEHNLNKYPSVTVTDSGGNLVIGDVDYVSNNIITVSFTGAFSGKVFLN